ncbi:MAG: phosphoenolpyruvate--protein phosphotransferase [Gammaproteobacteria bacterium]|uniref:Phosphoenolpyruvate-protein phosphotransferase n=1 Tax=Candidatus Thiopontia autotrophica TaxID=2841688 RepID=A0A8J6P9A5_9GAMM|nr:phosphoenolpyruvate--protein phosphotransferase [Candidatus Thiopontia autotrophica]MBL6969335.1 phosphoenolpyruvate--protein phosphotransferase [Gammaproteobacteria bacterium]
MSIMLHGIGVAKGIALGQAYLMEHGQPDIAEYTVPDYLIDSEIDRYTSALETAREQLIELRSSVPVGVSGEVTDFIDAHLLMLEDSAISRAPTKMIRHQQCNAEWALKQQRDTLVQVFEEMDDPYLRTRKDDIDHVINRIMKLLLQQETDTQELMEPEEESTARIIVADNLTAADILQFHHQNVAGIITEHGAPNSHSAILARSLHIPAVMGAGNVHRYLRDGEPLIINGDSGMILIDSDEKTIDYYQNLQNNHKLRQDALAKLRSQAAVTRDNTPVSLQANVELQDDITAMHQVGCNDIGLYRTEFLFLNRDDLPTEEEQYENYKAVIEKIDGALLTIRTLDIGTDKPIPAIADMEGADNPALGLRAIRLSLKNLDLLIPQIRAILRASAHGNIRMMLPMVSSMQEITQVQNHITQEKKNLRSEKVDFDDAIKIGAMIETPGAALSADGFAQKMDFLSIGTNDLIQYTLAIDRTDDQVNYLFDPLHPSILRLIHRVIQEGNKYGIPVSMCGEMAGDDRYTRLLLGMGLREFSMNPSALSEVKQVVLNTRLDIVEPQAEQILKSPFHNEVRRLFEQLNSSNPDHE